MPGYYNNCIQNGSTTISPQNWGVSKIKILAKEAIFLIDNAMTHPRNREDGNTIGRFLPRNVTSLVQPLDQGVLKSFKRHYRI